MKIFRPPGEPPVRHDDVVAQGCADWDRRVSDAIAGRTSWKRCVYACLGIIAVSVSGNIWLAGQSKVQVIHVVHDSIGGVIAVSVSSDPQGDPTQAMLKAALENWIVDVRTIYIDVNALRRSIQAAYDLLEGRSRAAGALTAFYTAQDPVKRAETETVSLENVVAVPPTSSDIGPDGLQTWRVTWIEHITSRDGQTETRQAWAGNITFKLKRPTTVAEASRDPDGIHIEAFSWTGGPR